MRALPVLVAALACCAACGVERPPDGGDKEQALAAATTAIDVEKVASSLASGADPNKTVRVAGDQQSPWYLALHQLRPGKPDTIAIIKAMLKAGANANSAWGNGARNPALPPESFWQRLMHSRTAGSGTVFPIDEAMMHPVPDVIRALAAAGFNPRLGQNALVSAIETGEIEIAHILVDAGVDVNCRPGAITPLVAAIEARNVALMTYLEEHGAREKP